MQVREAVCVDSFPAGVDFPLLPLIILANYCSQAGHGGDIDVMPLSSKVVRE